VVQFEVPEKFHSLDVVLVQDLFVFLPAGALLVAAIGQPIGGRQHRTAKGYRDPDTSFTHTRDLFTRRSMKRFKKECRLMLLQRAAPCQPQPGGKMQELCCHTRRVGRMASCGGLVIRFPRSWAFACGLIRSSESRAAALAGGLPTRRRLTICPTSG